VLSHCLTPFILLLLLPLAIAHTLQEPDAAHMQADDKSDPDFSVAKDELAAADAAAAEEPATGEAGGCG
jgi:hypothetical protein